MKRIATLALLIDDYDTAIEHYTDALGFELREDRDAGDGKRWVVIGPPGSDMSLLLAKAANDRQRARIGDQTGGRVFLFLETDDFARDHARMIAKGIHFEEPPRREPYGTVAVFQDRYGNRWDLIEPKSPE